MDLFGKEVVKYAYARLYILHYERSLLQNKKDIIVLG